MSLCSVGHTTHYHLFQHDGITISLTLSKSISNRVQVCAALSDIDLPKKIIGSADDSIDLHKMLTFFRTGKKEFHAHLGATGFRFMLAILSAHSGQWILTADSQLVNRPHDELIRILTEQGAKITPIHNGYEIIGTKLSGGGIDIDVSRSSQYLSALMMIGPLMKQPPTFKLSAEKVSFRYVNMTMEILRDFGIEYLHNEDELIMKTNEYLPPKNFCIEKDWSSAAFWFELAALIPNTKIYLPGLRFHSLQPDRIVKDYFSELGVYSNEQENTVLIEGKNKSSRKLQFDIKNCPDVFLPLALACVGEGYEVKFKGISHLTFKESNRIKLLEKNLKRLNISCAISTTGSFHIRGNQKIKAEKTNIDYGNDHRMAMAFAILSVKFPQIQISDMTCVSKSYPEFIHEYKKVKKWLNKRGKHLKN